MNYPAVFFYALGPNTRNSCHPNKLHRVTSFTCTLLFASWTCVLHLTVGLLVTCSGSRTAKLLGLAASGVSNQQGTVIGDQNVADLLLWLLIYICKQTTCSYISNLTGYPKILLYILRTAFVWIFGFFLRGGRGRGGNAPPISQNEAVSNVNFSSIHLAVWTHSFNYTDTLHLDDFILFTSAKVVLDRRPQNTFSKNNAPCVLLSLMPTCPFLNICSQVGFVSFVSRILPPLPLFCAATNHRQLQTCHIGRWLTSVKFQCKVDVHWFNKLFWPIRTGRIHQAPKWLEIYKCQRTITPRQRSTIGFAGNNLASFTSQFLYFLETLCPYFKKYRHTSKLPADFHTNTGKYRQVGRSGLWTHLK